MSDRRLLPPVNLWITEYICPSHTNDINNRLNVEYLTTDHWKLREVVKQIHWESNTHKYYWRYKNTVYVSTYTIGDYRWHHKWRKGSSFIQKYLQMCFIVLDFRTQSWKVQKSGHIFISYYQVNLSVCGWWWRFNTSRSALYFRGCDGCETCSHDQSQRAVWSTVARKMYLLVIY